MGIWNIKKLTFTNPNELHNKEAMKGMFDGTGLTVLYIDQDPQAALKNKMGKFDDAYIKKSYTQAQGKDNKSVTIAIRSFQIGMKLQARTKRVYPSGINIVPDEDPYIASGLIQVASEDENASLLGGAYPDIDQEGDDISLLDDEEFLTGGDVYSTGDNTLGASTATGHTSASKVKKAPSILTQ